MEEPALGGSAPGSPTYRFWTNVNPDLLRLGDRLPAGGEAPQQVAPPAQAAVPAAPVAAGPPILEPPVVVPEVVAPPPRAPPAPPVVMRQPVAVELDAPPVMEDAPPIVVDNPPIVVENSPLSVPSLREEESHAEENEESDRLVREERKREQKALINGIVADFRARDAARAANALPANVPAQGSFRTFVDPLTGSLSVFAGCAGNSRLYGIGLRGPVPGFYAQPLVDAAQSSNLWNSPRAMSHYAQREVASKGFPKKHAIR